MPIETFHETEKDRKVEKQIARVFSEAWGLEFFKLPQNHTLDVTFHRKGNREPLIWGSAATGIIRSGSTQMSGAHYERCSSQTGSERKTIRPDF